MSLSKPTMSAIRFGYGIRPGETVADGPDALLAQLDKAASAGLRFPAEGIEGRYDVIARFTDDVQKIRRAGRPDRAKVRENLGPVLKKAFYASGRDKHLRVAQSALSPYGFHERLAVFWTNHFSVSIRKVRAMYLYAPLFEAEAIRPHIAGAFETLLAKAVLHPAMLTYLDQIKSIGPNSRRGKRKGKGLNENLGRELLELHTLGVGGGYDQADVRDAALILTGLSINKDNAKTEFKWQLAEPGPLKFKGKNYGGSRRSIADVEAMLVDLAANPQTGKHICRKLAVHFVSDTPPEALVDAMVAAWTSSRGNLTSVYAAMLKHPAAWDNPGEKARQPYDFVVAGLRALNVPEKAFAMPDRDNGADQDEDTAAPARPAPAMSPVASEKSAMKMTESEMANPDMASADMANPDMAADDDEAMERKEDNQPRKKGGRRQPPLNPLTVGVMKKLGQSVWEPSSPAGFDESFGAWVTSSQLTGRIEWAQRVSALYAGQLDPDAMLKATLRDAARADTIAIVRQAPNRTSGMALVLASPEFNRR